MKEKFTLRLWPFDTASYKLAETYLEQMAERGLLLRKIGRNDITCYEKIEKGTRLKFHIHVQKGVQDTPQKFEEFQAQMRSCCHPTRKPYANG